MTQTKKASQSLLPAGGKPFVGKTRRVFPTGSKSPLANCQRAFPYLDLQHVHEVERNDQASKHDGDRGAELDEDVQGRAGSILERVADGVADNGSLVLLAALAGLGAFPKPLTLIEVFAAYSIALLLTMFPLTPGGLGTADAALVALLTGFGASSSTALAADLIWRLVWFLPQLLVGLAAYGIYRLDRRKQEKAAATA